MKDLSREIDAKVAEAMGGAVLWWNDKYSEKEEPMLFGDNVNTLVLEYSTSITAAMTVIDFWRNTGKFCCIELSSDYNYVWDVFWVKENISDTDSHSKQSLGYSVKELPMAICLSFLEAMKKE